MTKVVRRLVHKPTTFHPGASAVSAAPEVIEEVVEADANELIAQEEKLTPLVPLSDYEVQRAALLKELHEAQAGRLLGDIHIYDKFYEVRARLQRFEALYGDR